MSADIEPKLKDILQDRVKTWPVEDQKKLAYAAFNIEAERQSIDPAAMGQFARTLTNAVAKQELDEPTKYWEKAKNDYFSNAVSWALGFGVCLIIAVVVLLVSTPQVLEISRDNEKVAIAQAIQHVVVFGTIVAAVFWGLRQILRMWAFYDDMRADAVEREALFRTFAALKGAGWLTDPDQTVILTALANKMRRSNVIGPEAPVNPTDVLLKHLLETAKRGEKPTH